MENTPTSLISNLPKQMIQIVFESVEKGTIWAYTVIFDSIKQFVISNWKACIFILIVILLIAVFDYFSTGRWKILGRVLYSYFYWGIVAIIALIFGPAIFANDWIDILLFLVYIVSFFFVGRFLRWCGVKN